MSQITTHILDTTIGKPAQGVAVTLYWQTGAEWQTLASGFTNADGRLTDLLASNETLEAGVCKLHFKTQPYFDLLGVAAFYPFVEIVFSVDGGGAHYHVPLLLNPFGYSTYRGS